MRALVDANILLRTAKADHPDAGIASAAMAQLVRAGHELCIVPQVIYEIWSVATRPLKNNGLGLSIRETAALVERSRAVTVVIADPPDLLDRWLDLVMRHEVRGKTAHDARLVAAMQAHGIGQLLTFNAGDFARYPGVTVVSPAGQ